NFGEVPNLDLRLTAAELAHGRKILHELFPSDNPTICIFTFATGSKMLDRDWWSAFYQKLKTQYSGYNLLEILPMENVSQIDFACPTFYSKDIREIGAVIASSKVFIGADSGIMHLASSVHTPILGLFGVTPPAKYEPYNNNSISLDRDHLGVENTLATLKKILEANDPAHAASPK
ncbi:MAG: lipopolysaccharide heptosyltransferase family protein, partial [Sphingobacteriales bacterium]